MSAALLALFFALPAWVPAESERDAGLARGIDAAIDTAIADGTIAGAVVAVGSRTGTSFLRAYGRVSSEPGAAALADDARFDVASLTKVLATAPVIVAMAEAGKLRLSDPVVAWLPELSGGRRNEVLLSHLLTHSSGLAEVQASPSMTMEQFLRAVASRPAAGVPGRRFKYADVNFILLGEIARRAGGAPLDKVAKEGLYVPLGMGATTFLPGEEETPRCVPTRDERGSWRAGTVQDGTARRLGGVAGHAGLFSTARDLAAFCRMMLCGGTLDGRRILSDETVKLMTNPVSLNGGTVVRGLGWDVSSPYASPKLGFGARSYGHTGYSGASLWLDDSADRFVVLLTSRVNYREPKRLNELRGRVSEVAARYGGEPSRASAAEMPAP